MGSILSILIGLDFLFELIVSMSILKKRNGDRKKMQEFSFAEDRRVDATVFFTAKGRINSTEAAYMQQIFDEAESSGCTCIIINMCLVYTLSSAGIRVILSMYKKLTDTGGILKIKNPSESVRNVIGMTALEELLLR